MAFEHKNLSPIGPGQYRYVSEDSAGTVAATDYFADAAEMLRVGDLIDCLQVVFSDDVRISSITAIYRLIVSTVTPRGSGNNVASVLVTDEGIITSIDIRLFGGVGDGTTDDTTAMTNFLTAVGGGTHGVIPAGVWAISPIALSVAGDHVSVECFGTIKNRDGASSTGVMLTLTGDGSNRLSWKGGAFDANGGAYGCFKWDSWDTADVDVERLTGIVCTTSSPSTTSGLWPSNVSKSRTKWEHAHDMEEGTSTQGSIPRVCSVSSTAESYADVIAGSTDTVHGNIVIGAMGGGRVRVQCTGLWKDSADNGIYNVDNAATVDVYNMEIDGIDEPVVNSGSGVVNLYNPVIRNASNSIGLENCGGVQVFHGDLEFSAGVNPFKTRSGNTASGYCRIYDSVIRCRPAARVCDFGSSGTLEEFVDLSNRWFIGHDSAVFSSGTIFSMSPGSRCRVESDSEWQIYDVTANIPNSTTYFINMPTVTELSFWNSRHINRTGNNTVVLRLASARQQLMSFKEKFSVTNVQSETEINNGALASAPPRKVWGTGAPTSGYWQRGSHVWNIAPSDGGVLGWICITAGTPGTWRAFGAIREDADLGILISGQFALTGSHATDTRVRRADTTGTMMLLGGENNTNTSGQGGARINLHGADHATDADIAVHVATEHQFTGDMLVNGHLRLNEAAAGAANTVTFGDQTQSTVGAAGGASALPATPSGYLRFFVGTTEFVIPYYAQA